MRCWRAPAVPAAPHRRRGCRLRGDTPSRASHGASALRARRNGSKHPHPNVVQVIGAWEARDGKLLVVMGARRRVGAFRACTSPQLTRARPAEFMAHSLRVKRTVNKVPAPWACDGAAPRASEDASAVAG